MTEKLIEEVMRENYGVLLTIALKELEEAIKGTTNLLGDRRHLGRAMFVGLGRLILPKANELYLSSHTPVDCEKENFTSYRLWENKPCISSSGHPDWGKGALIEMWAKRGALTDFEIYNEILRRDLAMVPQDSEIIRNTKPYIHFCRETRIYRLK